MNACGLIVEYNPFHNGHIYHLQQSKKVTKADCMIAVMSGQFLQRGEPAIIDKYHRTRAALAAGIDIVLELPYPYAVQSSELFATGSVLTLAEIGVHSLCFGSESGEIDAFTKGYQTLNKNEQTYKESLTHSLKKGYSFPKASTIAYEKIGLKTNQVDLSKPNNILGFSYVKAIKDHHLNIQPYTIQRTKSNYHDTKIDDAIASATSIRKQLLQNEDLNHMNIHHTLPTETINQLQLYKEKAGDWHSWEAYFPFLQYRVMTMSTEELATIEGVNEGLEYRIKSTVVRANSFYEWMESIKSKRYTWTRLQRIFVHILTNTRSHEIEPFKNSPSVPYIRLLGLTETGQAYLHKVKKHLDKPVITSYQRNQVSMLDIEERATNAYYSILKPQYRELLRMQELKGPIRLKA